jgi:hypothetical protein
MTLVQEGLHNFRVGIFLEKMKAEDRIKWEEFIKNIKVNS